MRVRVADLKPLHSPAVSGDRPRLRALTDDELVQACNNPINGDPPRVNVRTGRLVDGNGRAYELQRRAADPASRITPDTLVRCDEHRPDMGMFPDL